MLFYLLRTTLEWLGPTGDDLALKIILVSLEEHLVQKPLPKIILK
jgi:hypothetical protein